MSFCQIVEFALGYDMNKCTAFRVADEIVHYELVASEGQEFAVMF